MMMTALSCTCGHVRLWVHGNPIMTTECHCTSCREAGARLESLDNVPRFRETNGGTTFVMYRKDRVEVVDGAERLDAFRLKPDAPSRRIVATCCNTPVFLEFKGGHWLSIYSSVWPVDGMPRAELRTMTKDLPDANVLDDTIKNSRTQSGVFFAKLLGAWIAMGFRSPRIEVNETLRV
jgi:hypothetical protein